MKISAFQPIQNQTQQPIATFVIKTFTILTLPQNASIIAWNAEGESFVIKDVKLFVNHVLPKYFRHRKYESFIRQLNMYNFRKIKNQQKPSFYNQFFRRQREDLLKFIHRKPEKKKRLASDLSFSSLQRIGEKTSFKEFIPENRQTNFIIIPLQTDLINTQKQQNRQKPRKVTFRADIESESEQNFSTLIKPSSKWMSKDDSCWQQIKSFRSFKVSIELLDDAQESIHSLKFLLAQPSSQTPRSCDFLQPCTLKDIN